MYRDSEGPSRARLALVEISDLLGSGLVPADLRAALFLAATGIPGVTVTDKVATLDGRTGVAVGRDEDGFRRELVFDPATGEYIGYREVALTDSYFPGIPAGDVVVSGSMTRMVVDSAPNDPESEPWNRAATTPAG